MVWSIAYDSIIGATVALVAATLALWWIGVPVLEWGSNHRTELIWGSVFYLPIGTGWAFFKWYLKLIDKREMLREQKDSWFKKWYPGQDSTKEKDWKEHVNDAKPSPKYHKEQIMTWLTYWPLSVFWTVFDDFVKRVAKAIYNHISGYLQRMSDRVFRDV